MYIKPIKRKFTISSPYGFRIHPISGKKSFHNGVDIPMYIGTAIHAEGDGELVVSRANKGDPNTGYGYYAVIQYSGYSILYAHLDELPLRVGTHVKKADVIGYSGNSGNSTGPHLHLEVRIGEYDKHYFDRDSKGRYYNSVDPEAFNPGPKLEDWERIIYDTMESPDRWIRYIKGEIAKGNITGDVCQFFPEFIMKLGGNDA